MCFQSVAKDYIIHLTKGDPIDHSKYHRLVYTTTKSFLIVFMAARQSADLVGTYMHSEQHLLTKAGAWLQD